MIYKKFFRESFVKGFFFVVLWGLCLEGLDVVDSWGKEDRDREEKDFRMIEYESRKCNEGRGVLLFLVNIKVVFVENGF